MKLQKKHRDPHINVFWDGYGLGNPASGVFQSARYLFEELASLDVHPRALAPFALPPPFDNRRIDSAKRLVPTPLAKLKLVWPLLTKAALLNQKRSNARPLILHGLSNINLPVFGEKPPGWRYIITVHDIIPLIEATGLAKKSVWQFSRLLPLVLREADAVITVSQWTKASLIRKFPSVDGKVHVIPNGFLGMRSNEIRPIASSKIIRTLTVARGETYKRLDLLVTLFRMYPETLNCTLVTDERGLAFIRSHAPDLSDSGFFRIYTNVQHELLSLLYQNTDIYLHPSLYEGFCMPAAEAIAHGKPVVYQAGSGIDEVVGGNVGIGLHAASSEADWLHAIEECFERSKRADWPTQIQNQIARQPSWKDAAEALKLVYANILDA